jgi:hypothetical protein
VFCPECGFEQPDSHRFCLWCGSRLPGELLPQPKVTQLFLGVPTHPADAVEPVLRVSLYREEEEVTTADGTTRLVGQHARFSIWGGGAHPSAAMSLPEDEARRLADFVRDGLRTEHAKHPTER